VSDDRLMTVLVFVLVVLVAALPSLLVLATR